MRCDVSWTETDSAVELLLGGVVDLAGASDLRALLLELIPADRDLVVSVTAVERLDGAGVQLLLATAASMRRRGRRMTVVAAGRALSALRLAGALEHLTVEGTPS